ncbi:putative oxidoreductase [BD1-7 clade bacterium]|uniref:Putative oxidoreductase n=1 Tax=BD1-7 clade bacterium TaxID=2029982 RepID=A0A5S9PYN3_9GAMM|nr:putative oxidoreductase [BD1-7 clade bacterium]CAA0109824.1 putative oxidoreductase [BD1-7 clade bacterium]
MQLPLRQFGQTDMKISALGLGTWQFSGGKGMVGGYWDALDEVTSREIVNCAVNGGINWFDTAQVYGGGESERNLSKALTSAGIAKEDVHIATKWWPVMKTAGNLKSTIDDRIDCLAPFPIAHHIVHQPFSISSVAQQMHAMADLMDAGKIQSVGVSNFSAKAMRKAHQVLQARGYALTANQVRYSMVTRNIETNGVLDAAKELGITIIAWSPLEQGLLTGRFHREGGIPASMNFMRKGMLKSTGLQKTRSLIDAMQALTQKYDATIAQIALNYTVNVHGDTVVAIPGASKVSQVEQNLGALRFRLDDDDIQALTALCTA